MRGSGIKRAQAMRRPAFPIRFTRDHQGLFWPLDLIEESIPSPPSVLLGHEKEQHCDMMRTSSSSGESFLKVERPVARSCSVGGPLSAEVDTCSL